VAVTDGDNVEGCGHGPETLYVQVSGPGEEITAVECVELLAKGAVTTSALVPLAIHVPVAFEEGPRTGLAWRTFSASAILSTLFWGLLTEATVKIARDISDVESRGPATYVRVVFAAVPDAVGACVDSKATGARVAGACSAGPATAVLLGSAKTVRD